MKRNRSSLQALLISDGLLPTFQPSKFSYSDLNLDDEEDFPEHIWLSEYALEQFEKFGIISEETATYIALLLADLLDERYEDDEQDEKFITTKHPNKRIPTKNIQDEIESLYSFLASADKTLEAAQIAKLLGDYLRAAQLLRLGYASPEEFYETLKYVKGLPSDYLYQLELCKAYKNWSLVNGYPKLFSQWVEAAKLRRDDYFAKQTISIPHSVTIENPVYDDPIIDALGSIGNFKALEQLAINGNSLAAAFLADMQLSLMINSSHSLDAADDWIKLQNGVWPSDLTVQTLLAANFPYDPIYAKKLEHLGLKYAGFRSENQCSQWYYR